MIKRITLFVFVLSSAIITAQKNNTSPYSFFGIGEETSYKTVEEIHMGEIGVAYKNPLKLSFSNPASLASLRLTNYSLGVESKLLRITDGTNSGSASSSALSYLALGFPVSEKAAFSFGLQPNTTVGYSLTEEFRDDEDTLTEVNLYTGEGGTNKVFAGFGINLFKDFNVGIEGSYIFGNIENKLLNRRDEVILATMHKTKSTLKGFNVRIGAQYDTKLNEKLMLSTGAVIDLESNLKNEGNEYLYTLVNTSTDIESPRDTLVNNSINSTIKKPLRTTLGLGIGEENKWYAGVEYSFQNALNFEDGILNSNTKISYDKSSRISFGGFYTPKYNSISNYWQRVTYRAGVKYKETGLVVDNTSINDFGMSFGVGLPVGQQLSNLNLGLEFGKRGEKNNGLVKENYINLRLSLTLNDKWFLKKTLN
jgi:hypothetical protein